VRRFSLRLFAFGMALGAVGAAVVLAANAYARVARPTRLTNTPATVGPATSPDQVIQWNRILLGILRTPGAQPATIHPTRSMAILHAAVYDAVNAIAKTNAPYLVRLEAPSHASEPAAAAAAAHAVLVRLYPAQAAALDADLALSLSQVPDGKAKDQGVRVGEEAAAGILTLRADDSSAATPIPFVPGRIPATTSSPRPRSFSRCSHTGRSSGPSHCGAQTSSDLRRHRQ
jgi:hypothetical protein